MASALGGSIARRYAKALFQIGVDRGNSEQLGKELGDMAAVFSESAELRQTLENPVFRPSEKRAILEKILPRLAPTTEVQRFVLLLLERRRITALPAIARAFGELVDQHAGRVRAAVVSAQPLGPGELDRIRRSLERRTGKTVVIKESVDPALIGGVVARVGDLVLDGSVRTQLASLREKLLN